jgi:GH24 family phage-related lysozyme (muramidase)
LGNWYQKHAGKLTDFTKGFLTTALPGAMMLAPTPKREKDPVPQQHIEQIHNPSPTAVVQKPVPQTNNNEIRDQLKQHEGYRRTVYKDSKGIPTIGVGFNLLRPDARSKIQSLGADYDSILSGQSSLTDQQVNQLFDLTLQEVNHIGQKVTPNYNTLHPKAKLVLDDLIFNIGPKLTHWKTLKQRLYNEDYASIAQSMKTWPWYEDVGGGKYSKHPKRRNYETRGDRLIRIMQEAANEQNSI